MIWGCEKPDRSQIDRPTMQCGIYRLRLLDMSSTYNTYSPDDSCDCVCVNTQSYTILPEQIATFLILGRHDDYWIVIKCSQFFLILKCICLLNILCTSGRLSSSSTSYHLPNVTDISAQCLSFGKWHSEKRLMWLQIAEALAPAYGASMIIMKT